MSIATPIYPLPYIFSGSLSIWIIKKWIVAHFISPVLIRVLFKMDDCVSLCVFGIMQNSNAYSISTIPPRHNPLACLYFADNIIYFF